MIRKRDIDGEKTTKHVIVYANEPVRIEIIGDFVLHGYKGTKTDMNQEPCIFHDTSYRA